MEAGAAYPEEDSGLIPDDEDIFDDPASETAETPSPFSRRTVLPDPPLEETLPAFGGYIRSAADEGGYPTIDFLVRTAFPACATAARTENRGGKEALPVSGSAAPETPGPCGRPSCPASAWTAVRS